MFLDAKTIGFGNGSLRDKIKPAGVIPAGFLL